MFISSLSSVVPPLTFLLKGKESRKLKCNREALSALIGWNGNVKHSHPTPPRSWSKIQHGGSCWILHFSEVSAILNLLYMAWGPHQEFRRFLRVYYHNYQQNQSKYLPWAKYTQKQPPLFMWSGEPFSVTAIDDWMRHGEGTWETVLGNLQRTIQWQ